MSRMAIWTWILVWLAAIAPAPAAAGDRRPDIVMVMIDTLRADFVGAYGFEGEVTPHIDRVASEGVLFENCIAQSPWTKPSVATLFSGLYPEAHLVLSEQGLYSNALQRPGSSDSLADGITTLAEGLKAAGYATGAFVANPWIRADVGFAQGFDTFREEGSEESPKPPGATLVAAASEWLVDRTADTPVFLYLHFMEVHGPYDAPDSDYEAVKDSAGLGPDVDIRGTLPKYLRRPPWTSAADAKSLRTWRGRYAAGVHAVDRLVGSLRTALEANGRWADTVLVVTSDHGEELNDHGHWDHGYRLFEDQIHVPLIFRLPGKQNAGKRIAAIVGLVDVMPTLLAVAGAKTPDACQGRSMQDFLRGRQVKDWPKESFAAGVKWAPEMAIVRAQRYKLLYAERRKNVSKAAPQLFDLAEDPKERTDIAAKAPETAAALEKKLKEHRRRRARFQAGEPRKATQELSPRVRERLRALGYLQDE